MDDIEHFVLSVPEFDTLPKSELIDYFAYYHIIVKGEEAVGASDIDSLFQKLRMAPYSNIPAYLSSKSKGQGRRYVKLSKGGYVLERSRILEIQQGLNAGPAKQETSILLRNLILQLKDPHQQAFLQEAIDCYEIGARRAAIVLAWILTVNHLFAHIHAHKLSEFNAVLAKNTDKRIKITSVVNLDDFTEIPEGKFVEFCRSAKIVSNDVRKILDEKLGTRNSAAHPSGVTISQVKATDFILDLIENVILKYPVK